ncbi:MAG: UTP--glucose-1-phosphate uridylyltransferase GalU [Gemmatimonas sp.]
MPKHVRKAVFPVAGMGTRFLPATKAVPKELLPVVDRPLLQYAIDEAKAAGIEHFVFVNGRGKGAIEDYFDRAFELETILERGKKASELSLLSSFLPEAGTVSFVRQQEPAGLGHAVWCARDIVGDEPFAVILPDDLVMSKTSCLKQLVDVHTEKGGNVVAVENVPRDQVNRYGVLDIASDDGRLAAVKGLVEKPSPDKAPSTLSIIGRYVLQPEIFDILGGKERGAGGEIQLTDAMAKLIGRQPFHGLRFEGTRYDCGNKLGFLQANVAFALARDDLRDGMSAWLKTLR